MGNKRRFSRRHEMRFSRVCAIRGSMATPATIEAQFVLGWTRRCKMLWLPALKTLRPRLAPLASLESSFHNFFLYKGNPTICIVKASLACSAGWPGAFSTGTAEAFTSFLSSSGLPIAARYRRTARRIAKYMAAIRSGELPCKSVISLGEMGSRRSSYPYNSETMLQSESHSPPSSSNRCPS